MANYLTGKQVLDRVFTRIKDNSPTLRVKMTAWLNSLMQDVVNEPRDWVFLHRTADIAVVSGALTLPADFSQVEFLRIGNFAFTPSDNLTPYQATVSDSVGGDPFGYTLTATTLTFHPAPSNGTATLAYKAMYPAAGYSDDTTATIFPSEWLPVFERVLLSAFYEYDVDSDRLPVGLQIGADQMRKMKALDNKRHPVHQIDPKGMLRSK